MKRPPITQGSWTQQPREDETSAAPTDWGSRQEIVSPELFVGFTFNEADAVAFAALPDLLSALEQWDAAAQEIADSLHEQGYHPDRVNILIDDTRSALIKAGYTF